jgi:hypothetical protein
VPLNEEIELNNYLSIPVAGDGMAIPQWIGKDGASMLEEYELL